MDDRERRIVEMVKEGKTYSEIGTEFGCTRQMVAKIVAKIKSKWRWYSEENND